MKLVKEWKGDLWLVQLLHPGAACFGIFKNCFRSAGYSVLLLVTSTETASRPDAATMCKYRHFITFYHCIIWNNCIINDQPGGPIFSPDIFICFFLDLRVICDARQNYYWIIVETFAQRVVMNGRGGNVEHIVPIGNYPFVCAELTPLAFLVSLPNYC